jgi:hypothetical protein
MSRALRRLVPMVMLCLATLLGGCIVYPDGGYRHGWGWHDHDWHEGWHR